MPQIIETLRQRRAAACDGTTSPQLPALLAPQDAGDLPRRRSGSCAWTRRGLTATRRRRRCATGAGGDRGNRFFPRTAGPAARHDCRPADWCISRQRSLGRAAATVPAPSETGRPAPRAHGNPDAAWAIGSGRHRGGSKATPRTSSAPGTRRLAYPRAPTSWRCGSTRHHFHHVPAAAIPGRRMTVALRPTCTWKATTSTAAGSTVAAAHLRHVRPAPYKALLTHGFTVTARGRKMSKSLGNFIVDPQETSKNWAPRSSASVGRGIGLFGRHRRRRQDPGARGGRLPPHPQHAAFPAGQRERLRPGDRRGNTRPDAGDRPTRWPARRSSRPRCWRTTRSTSSTRWARLQLHCSEDRRFLPRHPGRTACIPPHPKSLARRSAQTALWAHHHAMLRWMAPFLKLHRGGGLGSCLATANRSFLETYAALPGGR